jgi:hypothetical protein
MESYMTRKVVFLLTFAIALVALQGAGAAPTLGPVKQISASGNNSFNPRLDINGQNVVAVYERWLMGTQASSKVFFVKSTDGGKTWGVPKKVYEFGDEQHNPDVAICGQYVYVTFAMKVGTEDQIQNLSSSDGGANFGMPETFGVARDAVDIMRDKPRLACHAKLAWHVIADGDVELRYTTDGGTMWNGPLYLEIDTLDVESAVIDNDGRNVYVGWEILSQSQVPKGAILFQRSIDAGMNFSSETTITFHAGDGPHPQDPEIAAFGSRVAFTYLSGAPTATDVRTMVSIDRGMNWPAAKKITTTGANPSISAAKNRLDLVYSSGGNAIYRSSITDGATWPAPGTILATTNQAGAKGTAIASLKGTLVAAWTQFKNNRHRVFARQVTP